MSIPHSSILNQHLEEYLKDIRDSVAETITFVETESEFKSIYKTTVATYIASSSLVRGSNEIFSPATAVIQRAPVLVACGQLQLAYVELRRLIEVVVSYPYFKEHPVEWRSFQKNPDVGFSRDTEKPITWAAHREMRWYSSYLFERYGTDESGLVKAATESLYVQYQPLSAYVHSGMAFKVSDSVEPPFEAIDKGKLERFRKMQKDIYVSALVILSAANIENLSKFSAQDRGWFDWCMGEKLRKQIWSEKFLQN